MLARAQGVVASTTKPQEYGPAKTVDSIILMDQYLVKFYDDAGIAHVDVLVKIGDSFYASPVGEEWCEKLGLVQRWLGDAVQKRVQGKKRDVDTAAVPMTDTVNVIGSKLVAATKEVVERLR
jgi:hypothetical protein